jgi:hypothetical protein
MIFFGEATGQRLYMGVQRAGLPGVSRRERQRNSRSALLYIYNRLFVYVHIRGGVVDKLVLVQKCGTY